MHVPFFGGQNHNMGGDGEEEEEEDGGGRCYENVSRAVADTREFRALLAVCSPSTPHGG